jgi:hypothetical protein
MWYITKYLKGNCLPWTFLVLASAFIIDCHDVCTTVCACVCRQLVGYFSIGFNWIQWVSYQLNCRFRVFECDSWGKEEEVMSWWTANVTGIISHLVAIIKCCSSIVECLLPIAGVDVTRNLCAHMDVVHALEGGKCASVCVSVIHMSATDCFVLALCWDNGA